MSKTGAGIASKVPGHSPDRPPPGWRFGEAGGFDQVHFGFGWHKVRLNNLLIAIPRSGEGPTSKAVAHRPWRMGNACFGLQAINETLDVNGTPVPHY